nr:PREDICTED: lymphocyte function-associated antigen 3 [Apteryx mantelli mantelli]
MAQLMMTGCGSESWVFGILGENFTFPVKIDKKLVEITWKKNKDKVAEWEEQSKTVYFTSLRNRGLLNKETGSLTIFNLENNDAATYALEYLTSDEKNPVLTFILTVLDPPSEPTISCNIGGDDLVLKCAAAFKKPLTYKQHQDVVILKKKVDASEKVTCFIKVSQTEKSLEFSLAECFPGAVRCQSKTGRCKHSLQKHSSVSHVGIQGSDSLHEEDTVRVQLDVNLKQEDVSTVFRSIVQCVGVLS